MEYKYKRIPKVIERKDYYPDGANCPTQVTVHKCFCRRGTIEHHCVRGFGDEWFEIKCKKCEEKYSYIELVGYEWKVYLE